MNDQYGRTITMTTTNGQDIYSSGGMIVAFPSGTDPSRALESFNAQYPGVPEVAPSTLFYPFDFLALFTAAERTAIVQSTDENVVTGWTNALAVVGQIDLTNSQTQQLIGYLVTVGLLTEARASSILGGQPPT